MERRHLEYFLAVASHGSFTSAASALRIAQPSLSHTIKALERELGASLFHRLGRGVALTAAGEALLGPARQALREFETARAQVQQVAGLEAGRLDIVALTSLAVDPLARLVGAFRIAHPGIQIRIVDPERAVAVTELVRAGECELGLVDYSAPLGGLSALELPDQEIYAVLPPQHAEQADEPLTLKQVVALGLVTTPPGSATRTLVELALAELGEAPQVAVETPHRAALVPLVVAGAGATLLPRPMAEDAVPHGVRVAPVVPPLTRRVRMVWRSGSVSAAGRAFIDMVPPAEARSGAHDSATSHRRGL